MQLRIAILHYSVPPVIGGVEATIGAHARLLRAHGHPVILVTGRGEDATLVPEMDSRHPRVESVQRELNHGTVTAEFHALAQALARALEGALRDADLVIAHNVVTLHKNLALTTALHEFVQARRIRLLAWCHDFAWTDPVYADEMHAGAPWNLMRARWGHTRYVVVSEARRRELARLLKMDASEISVVPPGVEAAEFFRVSSTTARWLNEFDLLDAAPLLLLPARVTRRKNIELAMDIVAALRENALHPKLVVMGPLGPHNPANRAYIAELKTRTQAAAFQGATEIPRVARKDNATGDVIFLQEHGAVSDVERRDLYALADALLFPSAREGFGIPILEAGLARLPIFCADIPPFRESAEGSAHYFGLDEAPSQIAARMAEFFAGDARYRLKRRVVEHFSWQAIYRERIAPLLKAM